MPKPPATTLGAQARSISLDLILPRTFAPTQDQKQLLRLLISVNPQRSLPSLTGLIELLERIQRSHVFIRHIALRLYAREFEEMA